MAKESCLAAIGLYLYPDFVRLGSSLLLDLERDLDVGQV